ncbi:MAG: hypothetical protein KJ064_24705 [Anaerolineae bacterium]|jgi:ribosomal protein L32|nr:MAG: zinc ribbon domain-containing protein [Anaerolineae bacterium]MCL4879879.1 hypothetical protein [Anaerolineae bacterium]
MTKKRLESEPLLPDIKKCPRCGTPVLLGDTLCKNCGYRMRENVDWITWFKRQPANVVAITLFVIGILIAASSWGMENPWRFLTLIIGSGLVIGGGLYYGANILFASDDRRKEK